ncbi:DNA-3-methyladenine glycosylase family protein [Chitinophaga solisilvae]|uniref:DNA-3-methyladenine glycosylase II n=1 Tax=Chitinophaga solisilvae TaxID=1233460 RepID=A0A433WKX5_9BACT|nr:DNA glycosylase [Chitinophaga solisilvae]NSL85242.1 DNA-3-methyladenine glycosylase 2 family protein [Chitinophaga solisilvae]
MRITVNDPANFSFRECLHFLGRSDKECLHYIQDGKLTRMMLAGGQPVVVELAEGAAAGYLEATVLAPAGEDFAEADIAAYITRWLHLDADLQSFYRYTRKDPVLKGMAEAYHGLRLVGLPDFFEAISWPIIGQQINLSFAYTLRQRFIQSFGYHEKINGTDYYLYPVPEVIAALTPDQLTPMQFSRSKALYVIETAKAIAGGQITAEMLAALPYEEAKARLTALKGIGNWSANYVLMKYHRFPQALPLEDVGLHNAIRQRLGLAAKPALPELLAYTQPWQQHAAYATFYLWRSLLPQ